MTKTAWTRRKALSTMGAGLFVAPALIGCRGKSGRTQRRPQRRPVPDVAESEQALCEVVRRIEGVPAIDGNGATVQRIFPTPQLRHLDPFVLLDDFAVQAPAGFPEHPHRGFEAFTYMIDGAFEHKDNLGNHSLISSGGTQRFNSGRGARHSEMPGSGGTNQGLQLWVNLPRRRKQMDPEYVGTPGEQTPVSNADDLRIRTVVGQGSPVALHTEVEYLDVTLLADGRFSRTIPQKRNTLVYLLAGAADVAGQQTTRGQAVLVTPGRLHVRGAQGTRFALLSGRPHDEPILHHGPFVD